MYYKVDMNIAVVGTGYVGLVTGTCFAEMGNDVVCVDIDENKVAAMRAGKIPIYEPQLEELFVSNITQERLSFTTNLKEGIAKAEVIFLALPTPPAEDGSADLQYVLAVANDLGVLLDHYAVVVDKSTVPIGTSDAVTAAIRKKSQVEFDVVSNPEFLKEGFAVNDFMNPDRIIIGTSSDRAVEKMMELYEPFKANGSQILVMDERSAEMTKYAANAFLATKISFMNEIANVCELVGADVDNVRLGIGSDERIGKRFLFPGIGYGGSCFPKDVVALRKIAEDNHYDFKILTAVDGVNGRQKTVLVDKLKDHFKGDLKRRHFALWGLAFKPGTDDIREAPALEIIDSLLNEDVTITCYDPEAAENVQKLYLKEKRIQFSSGQYEALEGADALIIATEWDMFKNPDFERVKQNMQSSLIFDGRNIYDLETMAKNGFTYKSIGRAEVG